MLITLGVIDDDSVDIVRTIEGAFDVKISNAEAAAIHTVGEMFDLLRGKIDATGRKCSSAMAFYRLRRALNEAGVDARAPSDDLARLHPFYTRQFVKMLEVRTGLRLPALASSAIGKIGRALMLGGVVGFVAMIVCSLIPIWPQLSVAGWANAAAILITAGLFGGGVLMRLDPGRLPSDCRTLGAIAAKSATVSYGRLIKQGAAMRDATLWEALVDQLAKFACVSAAQIAPETYFLRSYCPRRNAAA